MRIGQVRIDGAPMNGRSEIVSSYQQKDTTIRVYNQESEGKMVGLTEVSGLAMDKTGKDVTRNVILWFPPFSDEHIMKDPGQITEHLANRGYNVKIVCYGGNGGYEIRAGNDEVDICRCLKGVRRGDNIIVVDWGNSDRTELA